MHYLKIHLLSIFLTVGSVFNVVVLSQDIQVYKQKFDKYLNLNHSLDSIVIFYVDKIIIKDKNGKEDIVIYKNEIPVIAKLLEAERLEQLEKFFSLKKARVLSNREKDSILISIDEIYSFHKKSHLPLSGIRIAIDPGHFANDIKTAKVEQRLLYFTIQKGNKKDTVKLLEGQLTYWTAVILADKLKQQGAEVLITRPNENACAFGVSFNEWMKKRKDKVLDSLYNQKSLTYDKYKKLKTCSDVQFFNLFFREYELLQRAKIINQFNPHLTIIIHYNVDEKNSPWKSPTFSNYSMCFIGGAFEEKDLDKMINKIHFLRLLFTNQIENSEKISHLTMQYFENHLNVSAAKKDDARYLHTVCIPTNQKGVYCRNLLLTRYIISPLVYGESMCQDNEKECKALSEKNFEYNGFRVPKRVYEVADAYYNSVIRYFEEFYIKNYSSKN